MQLNQTELIKEFRETLKGTELEKYSEQKISQAVSFPFLFYKRQIAKDNLLVFKSPFLGTFEPIWEKMRYCLKNLKQEEPTRENIKKIKGLEKAMAHLKSTERRTFYIKRYQYDTENMEKEN